MLEKITVIEQEDTWNSYIKKSLDPDFFHSWQYHSLDNSGKPILFVLSRGDDFIALPLIKRKVDNSDWFDLTSVYGYAGPISNKKFEDIDETLLSDFELQIGESMRQAKCICAFSRLHPFIDQPYLLNKIGGVYGNGKTIYVDLTVPLEEQRENYDKRLARRIRQLRKKKYTIKEATTIKEIAVFTEMYTQNMKRVNATKNYFFTEEYFTKLLQITDFNCKLLMIYNGEEAVCGATVMYSDNIIRNHLSATSDNYVRESPSKLLTDEISLLGRKLGLKYFHLGGGVGGKEDSLFKFKNAFSNLTLNDYIWKFIADHDAYNSLLSGLDPNIETNFFPLYRSISR